MKTMISAVLIALVLQSSASASVKVVELKGKATMTTWDCDRVVQALLGIQVLGQIGFTAKCDRKQKSNFLGKFGALVGNIVTSPLCGGDIFMPCWEFDADDGDSYAKLKVKGRLRSGQGERREGTPVTYQHENECRGAAQLLASIDGNFQVSAQCDGTVLRTWVDVVEVVR